MNIKSLLLGSAAALVAVSGARAADAVVIAEPEPMEYVRVCDVYGTGYYYIPGTETCLKIGGRVRFDINAADSYSLNSDNGWATRSRAEIYMDSASETEYGTLKTNAVFRFNWDGEGRSSTVRDAGGVAIGSVGTGNSSSALIAANITLGGLLVGLADSYYTSFVGYAGDIINDDVVSYGPFELNQIAYSFNAGGFSGYIAVEDDGKTGEDYAPDVTGGVGFSVGDFGVKVVGGYDESADEGAIKARIDGKFGAISAFLMGGYNTDGNSTNKYAPGTGFASDPTVAAGVDGTVNVGWGDWALWGGLGTQFSDTLGGNVQVAYTDNKTLAVAANLKWYPVANLLIQPEVTYTKVDYDYVNSLGAPATIDDDQWNFTLRFQRTF
ncbi:MAG: porin [Rhizobiaceae bacterium]|nr:porin [Rhizobiaceae bacterium]